MLRETRNEEQVLDRTAEVAATIAEEGLRYVSDSAPGYTRKRTGTTFSYYDKDGKRITDAAVIRRIESIGIPPAYESVWICPSANGHIQATGLDARGRKQYRYHAKWRELRDQNKYEHIIQFAAALPALRDRVAADMKLEGLPCEKVLATIVSLLEKTLIRVGNAEYAEKNKSYGLTTMRRKHVAVGRGVLRFDFTGKSGKQWKLRVEDKRIAAIVKRCAEIPGHELFKYLDDDGQPRTVDSGDVNAYIKDITGADFSAKDFRTWAGTVLAALALTEFKKYDSQAEAKRNVVAAIESVSRQLGNTPSICRKCYVHPEVLNAYMSGDLVKMIEAKIAQKFKRQYAKLTPDEIMVLAFLAQASRFSEGSRLGRVLRNAKSGFRSRADMPKVVRNVGL
ncbi:DNA topoisomerase-1 [Bradyrhizobium sp. USDA 326]|uniref:DNA topoisomerase IB n=1 Tax=Bradyrhizobium sp. USDA 326 TaxID=3377726 RepID=UPI003C75A565